MPAYAVNHRYRAVRDGDVFGPYEPGMTVELGEDDAAWVNRDSPGALQPVIDLPVELSGEGEPLPDAPHDGEADSPVPQKDRAHRGGRKRAG